LASPSGGRRPAIHDFADHSKKRRGWPAFADHDGVVGQRVTQKGRWYDIEPIGDAGDQSAGCVPLCQGARRRYSRRRCQPEDLAGVILFLGFGAAMVTGQTITVMAA
jgi:hypothetical protein